MHCIAGNGICDCHEYLVYLLQYLSQLRHITGNVFGFVSYDALKKSCLFSETDYFHLQEACLITGMRCWKAV